MRNIQNRKNRDKRAAGLRLMVITLGLAIMVGCGNDDRDEEQGNMDLIGETLSEREEMMEESRATEDKVQIDDKETGVLDLEQPVVYRNTWKGVPGDAFGIYGANFMKGEEGAQVYLAPMSGYDGTESSEAYELNILCQDDGVILTEIPTELLPDQYIGFVRCGGKDSDPFYVNMPELDWIFDTEVCAGLCTRVFGRNLLNPRTGSTEGAELMICTEDGERVLEAEIVAATDYTVDFIVPEGVEPGKRYSVRYHNGAGSFGTVTLGEKVLGVSDSQMKELRELYGVEASWASYLNLTDVFNVKDYGAKGDGKEDDREAFMEALSAAGQNGGGIVYLPEGIYDMTSATVAFTVPNNVVIAGDGRDRTVLLTNKAVTFSSFYGGITKLTLRSESKRPLDDTRRLIFGYTGNLLHVGGYMHFFAKKVGIETADGQGFVSSGAAQIILEDCSVVCTHTAILLENPSRTMRTRIRDSYCYNNQRGLLWFGPYTWVEHNLFEGENGGENCEKGNDGKVHTMEHRICDMWGDYVYYGNNTIIGTFGDMREDVEQEDNCGEGILNQEDGRIGIGEVESADGVFLFSADMDFDTVAAGRDPVAGEKGTKLIGAKLFLISGKGMGQRRIITMASQNKLWLDEPWDYPPEEGDLFVIDSGVPERNIIVGNLIEAQTRKGGIMYYGRSCDNIIADNTLTNSGGIWFGQAQRADTDRFGMSYFNYVDGNQLSGGIRDKKGVASARDNTLTIGMGDDGGCGFQEDPDLPELTAYYGNLYQNNTILGSGTDLEPEGNYNALFMLHNGIVVADASEYARDISKGTIVAHNKVTNSLNGVSVSTLSNYTLLYKNEFRWNKINYNDADSRNTVTITEDAAVLQYR